jgi:methyl-accepting chemotaxis protein
MVRVADGAGDSLFTEIERSLAPVVGLLAKSAAANYNLARAIDSVAETVAQISTFVIDIEAIGEEIKLIALNSQIKAALTGDEGAGLGVLAEAIQCLSVDACAQATAIACTLREITWVTEELSRGAARETHTGELSVETMAGCLKTIIDSIRAMNDGVMATLAQSDAAAQDLSHDIESATGGIMTHGVITAEVDGIIGELDKIMAQAHRISPEAAMADLAALSARYTMHSERKIHAAFTGLGTADLCESALQNGETMTLLVSGVEESELGNNVELF